MGSQDTKIWKKSFVFLQKAGQLQKKTPSHWQGVSSKGLKY